MICSIFFLRGICWEWVTIYHIFEEKKRTNKEKYFVFECLAICDDAAILQLNFWDVVEPASRSTHLSPQAYFNFQPNRRPINFLKQQSSQKPKWLANRMPPQCTEFLSLIKRPYCGHTQQLITIKCDSITPVYTAQWDEKLKWFRL